MLIDDIKKVMGVESYTVDNDIKVWLDCYRGESYWLQDKYERLGNDAEDIQSLNLCAGIPSELARLTTMELKTNVDDENINDYYQQFIKHIRKFVEYGLALGGIVIKPYVESTENKKIGIDIATADKFVVLGFTSFGDINHIVFIDRIKKVDKDNNPVYFTRLEEHIISDVYKINNTAYISDKANELGDKSSRLDIIDEWANLEVTTTLVDRDKPLFAYFKNPQANNLDLNSFEGISCFAKALSLIQDADEQYQRLLWEFKGGELAIDADVTVLEANGELPAGKKRLYRNLGLDQKDGFYEVFSPTLRDESLINGLNQILRRIEFICGLAFGTISETEYSAKTATEIKMSQQRSYSTVIDIQNELQKALEEFAEIIEYWLDKLKVPVSEKWDISFDFDDSLVVDSEVEQKIRLQEVAAGILSTEAYLEWRYGATGDQVEDLMPNLDENHNDVAEEE